MTQKNQEVIKVYHVLEYCKPSLWIGGPLDHPYRIIESYRIQALQQAVKKMEGTLLDFGCGTKPYEPLLKSHFKKWFGIDLKDRTTGPESQNRADTVWDGITLPLEKNSFDVVLATQVLEHVENIENTLKELARVLRPGGYFLITVPMTGVLHEEPWDFRRFTPYGLRNMLEPLDIRLETSVALGGVITTITTLISGHISFLRRIPVFGNLCSKIVMGILTQLGLWTEVIFFKVGYRQAKITTDYLFILKKN